MENFTYGSYIELGGGIRHVGVEDVTTEYPQSEHMIDTLESLFREQAHKHECKATAIVCDVRVKVPDRNRNSDAVQVRLDHVAGYSTEVFFPYEVGKDEILYGESFSYKGQGTIFRHHELQ